LHYRYHVTAQKSGLAYFSARYYDPILGRFMGIDPVAPNPENIHSFNRYAYANNNPYKFVDPDGRLPILIPLAAFVAKEAAAEVASYYTGGWSDYLSVRRVGTKVVTAGADLVETKLSAAVREGIRDWPVKGVAKSAGKSARTPVGRSGQQNNFPNPNAPKPRNAPETINGRDYSGHAIDRMQERGFTPSVVENALNNGVKGAGNKPNTSVFTDTVNNFRVITNSETGKVITVIGGGG